MRARQFIEHKSRLYAPATRDAMIKAFEEAWSFTAHTCRDDGKAIETQRLKLAECVSIVTAANMTDVEQIRLMALNMLRIIDRVP